MRWAREKSGRAESCFRQTLCGTSAEQRVGSRMSSRANQRQNKSNRENSDGEARAAPVSSSFDEAELQARLDANIAQLVDDANRGQPIWWQPTAWRWGLPMWAMSGRVFRGLSALLLWHGGREHTIAPGWLEADSPNGLNAFVVPIRKKRGWAPLLVTPVQRMAPAPFSLPDWDPVPFDLVWHELNLERRTQFVPYLPHIRELSLAFLQALYRSPKSPPTARVSTWTAEALTIAATVAAFMADAAYGRAMGKVFDENAVWTRGDVAALFPWEAQTAGGPRQTPREAQTAGRARQTSDRSLARTPEARILRNGKRAGQLPMPPDAQLRLDRVWERGQIVAGYGRLLELLDALNVVSSGDPVLDARRLGRVLAGRLANLKDLPDCADRAVADAWQRVLKRIRSKSWAHRLHLMKFADIQHDKRWSHERLLPRVRAIAGRSEETPAHELGRFPLARIGLVRLLDAMGERPPDNPMDTADLTNRIGAFPDRTYQRQPIFKEDGTRRWLDVPNEALATVQKKIMHLLRPAGPFVGVATAFEPGRAPALHARIHAGAVAAVIIDIADFFGSIRPRHIRWAIHPRPARSTKTKNLAQERWLRAGSGLLMEGGDRNQREALLSLLFAGHGKHRWLPQGAPSSPWVANLAAHPVDRRIRKWAREYGNVRYSRYADDLVLSLHTAKPSAKHDDAFVSRFLREAEKTLREAVRDRGWEVQEKKTRRWRKEDQVPLTLCGIEVPTATGAFCRLPRRQHRRSRAALHRLRCGQPANHGTLAWAWGATGHPGWLAWTNPDLTSLAIALAGPILAESLLSGWADSVDDEAEVPGDDEKVDE